MGSTRPDEVGGYRWSVVAETSLPTSEPPAGDLTGRLLAGRYRLTGRIASGGMAQVWEATDEVLTRRVAVKILHPHLAADSSFVGRFRAEAVAAARLAHPSIVSVYDTFRDQGVEAIVMELVRGTTLRARLDEHGALDVAEVLGIGAQVADALGAAHQTGLVHRDIKPANILLSADGRVLVADFGIAKAAESGDFTTEGLMVGTAKYVAPEQVEGKPVDGRTDVYSLGIVLYESLCGRVPFRGETDAATALQRLHAVPLRPRQVHAEIPRSVEAVVMRSMEREPSLRYPDADALRGALLSAGADPADAEVAAVHANGASIPIDANPDAERADQQGFVQSERDWLVPGHARHHRGGRPRRGRGADRQDRRRPAHHRAGHGQGARQPRPPHPVRRPSGSARPSRTTRTATTGSRTTTSRPSPSTGTSTPRGRPRATTTPTSRC